MTIPQIDEHQQDEFVVTTDPARMDQEAVYEFLSTQAYWSQGLPRSLYERSVAHALNFSLLHGDRQIGYARVISDYASFAYLADVYVLEEYRGRGLGKWMIRCVMAHPDLQNLRNWMLITRDKQDLYRKFGFLPVDPARVMSRRDPDVYARLRGE